MPSRTLRPHGVKVLVKSVSIPILMVSGSSTAGSVAGSVAASVAASVATSVAGASVAGASVAGASVAGAAVSVAWGAPHAVRISARIRRAVVIRKVIPFFLFILPPILRINFIGTNKFACTTPNHAPFSSLIVLYQQVIGG